MASIFDQVRKTLKDLQGRAVSVGQQFQANLNAPKTSYGTNRNQAPILPQQIRQPIQNVGRSIANAPLTSAFSFLPGASNGRFLVQQGFSPTVGQYAQNQIIKPIQQGVRMAGNSKESPFNRALGGLQAGMGAFSATPVGGLYNMGFGGLAGTARAMRTGTPLAPSIRKGISEPTSFASQGLGIQNPILALGLDVVSGNPKQGFRQLAKIKNFGNTIKGVNPRAFSMRPEHLDEAKLVLDRLRGQAGKLTTEDRKYILGTAQALIQRYAPGFKNNNNKDIVKVLENLIQTNEKLPKDLRTRMPTAMGLVDNPLNAKVGGSTAKVATEVSQTPQIHPQPQLNQVKALGEAPQAPTQAVGGTGGSSSKPIVSQKDKYAFNINKPKLGLTGESAKKLDEVVEEMRPILEQRKGKPLTDKKIITAGRKAQLLDTVMGREDSVKFAEALQASRNFLKSEASKKGLTPEFLAQIEIVSSHASDKGRSLRAFAVDAENTGIKQLVVKDLQKLGIRTERLIEAAKNVDWDDAKQVTEFYRKFKPATFLEMLEEYRYANMLSSPSTQIVNTFSAFLQGGVVTPIEKTITGTLDFARSRLTGTEQKYFASQGVDYTKGYWKALPEGWGKFKSILAGQGGLTKPDVDFIPTGTGTLHKIYTTPLRALEATDQFFRTLVIGGETKSLQKAGITGAEALKKAEAEATYRTFRQVFDPDGKLGQGGLLKLWDKWNVGINHLRQLPGGKWIVPFLQTPTNILKQGVEYSPLGITTIPGSKEPMVQLSKTIIGSGVFVGAYSLAEAGLTTWDVPINKKDKDAFYEAGLQPYSVKIGNTWVSYSKLGPLSYPIAMAAAMKWAKDNGGKDSLLNTAGAGVGGFLQFFADQSYMQGIGDVIDAVRGDEWKQGRSLANIPSQLIPYRAFQGWVARLVDPVYRKTSNDGILEQATDSIKSQIPVVSKTLEPYVNSRGEESKRSNPLFNAISPVKTSKQVETYMPRSTKAIYGEFNKLNTPQEKATLWEQMVKDKRITKENVADIKRHFIDDQLQLTDKEVSMRSSGVADGSRTREVLNEFNKLTTMEEKAALWEKYVRAKIITKDVAKQLIPLLQQ